MITVQPVERESEWNELVMAQQGHPLQLWGWGEVKAAHNWQVTRVVVSQDQQPIGAAQLLVRRLPWPFRSLVYIPRGPMCNEQDRTVVLEELAAYARHHFKAVAVTIEPDWQEATGLEGWRASTNTILIPRTLLLDLSRSEDELLAEMTKKTRQYIRKSANEAIVLKKVTDRAELDKCLAIYRQTAQRAGFALHGDQYYYDVAERVGESSVVMAAYYDDQPIAFLWTIISGTTSFELYGGMNETGQRLRANYALKWHTIQRTKAWGVRWYDFNGLLNDGVSTFKQGFASHENMLVGTYDRPLSPLYTLWDKGLPMAKKAIRLIKKR